ncbi:hypothetical protein SARC_08159 [Sphaeroforma arctica JP610]|uniref:C2H2-type domain-containing protein n=1 Tax=Sphaeroforma arctica JP610 TaxID=667725 RepID=A0A0L0FRX5_9EUKA|nr:hypothetical protein SARC_08159 [Sphaeroforma arctica JP610]KNC79449.1 hypothetical protein SARC_08159 [Sphaeroforma arctica JP610]|eukprot:XP_014153351.1 hypothetical protein SARC_08159 [Sphaeroforma arctica JP610]
MSQYPETIPCTTNECAEVAHPANHTNPVVCASQPADTVLVTASTTSTTDPTTPANPHSSHTLPSLPPATSAPTGAVITPLIAGVLLQAPSGAVHADSAIQIRGEMENQSVRGPGVEGCVCECTKDTEDGVHDLSNRCHGNGSMLKATGSRGRNHVRRNIDFFLSDSDGSVNGIDLDSRPAHTVHAYEGSFSDAEKEFGAGTALGGGAGAVVGPVDVDALEDTFTDMHQQHTMGMHGSTTPRPSTGGPCEKGSHHTGGQTSGERRSGQLSDSWVPLPVFALVLAPEHATLSESATQSSERSEYSALSRYTTSSGEASVRLPNSSNAADRVTKEEHAPSDEVIDVSQAHMKNSVDDASRACAAETRESSNTPRKLESYRHAESDTTQHGAQAPLPRPTSQPQRPTGQPQHVSKKPETKQRKSQLRKLDVARVYCRVQTCSYWVYTYTPNSMMRDHLRRKHGTHSAAAISPDSADYNIGPSRALPQSLHATVESIGTRPMSENTRSANALTPSTRKHSPVKAADGSSQVHNAQSRSESALSITTHTSSSVKPQNTQEMVVRQRQVSTSHDTCTRMEAMAFTGEAADVNGTLEMAKESRSTVETSGVTKRADERKLNPGAREAPIKHKPRAKPKAMPVLPSSCIEDEEAVTQARQQETRAHNQTQKQARTHKHQHDQTRRRLRTELIESHGQRQGSPKVIPVVTLKKKLPQKDRRPTAEDATRAQHQIRKSKGQKRKRDRDPNSDAYEMRSEERGGNNEGSPKVIPVVTLKEQLPQKNGRPAAEDATHAQHQISKGQGQSRTRKRKRDRDLNSDAYEMRSEERGGENQDSPKVIPVVTLEEEKQRTTPKNSGLKGVYTCGWNHCHRFFATRQEMESHVDFVHLKRTVTITRHTAQPPQETDETTSSSTLPVHDTTTTATTSNSSGSQTDTAHHMGDGLRKASQKIPHEKDSASRGQTRPHIRTRKQPKTRKGKDRDERDPTWEPPPRDHPDSPPVSHSKPSLQGRTHKLSKRRRVGSPNASSYFMKASMGEQVTRRPRVPCQRCKQTFATQKSLQTHMGQAHHSGLA